MKQYIGIDLGTTNSAICSYDGENLRIWKSPQQYDVTPSAIYINKRGNRYYGADAYEQAAAFPDSSATLFKRYMGTNTKMELPDVNLCLTPEECSAEILKVLFGYLPEEIRNSDEVAVVITVPAAFNQMKKDATLQAAQMAGFEKVALMQEPVAAIMSVMKTSKQEGIFLVYDLGGGTFDVSIADNFGGKVNLLAHGGVEMCGGRDIDKQIFNSVVVPWLTNNFNLPKDFLGNPKYKRLHRLSQLAAEKAKIALSPNNESTIALDETLARTLDLDGNDIYLDIPLTRSQIDMLISELIADTIEATRETMKKVGLTANDIEKIVFVGGPTNYGPLRDKVAFELSLPPNTSVNPMTAVAEGASIFAESIDWNSERHNRKPLSAEISSTDNIDISFKYIARTPDSKAKVAFQVGGSIDNFSFQITSLDSGWSSGRTPLQNHTTIDVPLIKDGDNTFAVTVYNNLGREIRLSENQLVITKTIATVGAIPASHSIGVEVLDKLGGVSSLDFLVKEGEALPKRGHRVFKSEQSLKAGSASSINIKLWEGSITNPVHDNRFIGMLKITGMDFDEGVIPAGADLECDYEISDSGNIKLEISIPSVRATLPKNFYSPQEGRELNVDKIAEEGQKMVERIDEYLNKLIDDPKLAKARDKAEQAASVGTEAIDSEDVLKAHEKVLESKKLLAQARIENLKLIRQMDLERNREFFDKYVRQYAKSSEITAYENQAKAAERSIVRNDNDFENLLEELGSKNFMILWRQDWFVIDRFNYLIRNSHNYDDKTRFDELKNIGNQYLQNDQIDMLREVVGELYRRQIINNTDEDMMDMANIIRG